jgi:hypothetical protein
MRHRRIQDKLDAALAKNATVEQEAIQIALREGEELDKHFADLILKRWCLWMFNHHIEPTLTRNGKPFEWQKFCPELGQ